MQLNEICFSVNSYDCDGDICETGIFLHFGETRVKVAETLDEFKAVAERISGMSIEISEKLRGGR